MDAKRPKMTKPSMSPIMKLFSKLAIATTLTVWNAPAAEQHTYEQEALRRCSNYVRSFYFITNGDFFGCSVAQNTRVYTHLRNVALFTTSVNLTSADRLNGIEWKGKFQVGFENVRSLLISYRSDQKWYEWNPGDLYAYNIELKNGTWRLESSGALFGNQPVAETELAAISQLPSYDTSIGINLGGTNTTIPKSLSELGGFPPKLLETLGGAPLTERGSTAFTGRTTTESPSPLPANVSMIIKQHLPKKDKEGEVVWARSEFDPSELQVLDSFAMAITGRPFVRVIASGCGECRTLKDHEVGTYVTFPNIGTFCESCGVGK